MRSLLRNQNLFDINSLHTYLLPFFAFPLLKAVTFVATYVNDDIIVAWQPTRYTGNDRYSGDRYSGNDGYSGLKTPDDAILFTVSGITAIADKNCHFLDAN